MFEARVIRSFTWSKRGDKLFKRKTIISDLTEEEKNYLLEHNVISDVKKITDKEVKVEKAVEKAKVEKAVKKTTKKK